MTATIVGHVTQTPEPFGGIDGFDFGGRKRLSPSGLGNYMSCLRKGQYYYDQSLPKVTTMGLLQGSAYHHGLEAYFGARKAGLSFDGVSDQDLFERAYAIAGGFLTEGTQQDDYVWEDIDNPSKEVEDALSRLATMLGVWAREPSFRWVDADVAGVEVSVVADFGSDTHYFAGVIDAVLDIPNVDGPILVDHKTAGRAWGGTKAQGDPRKLIQAPLYAEAWFQQTGVEPGGFAYDVMTVGGKFNRVWVDVSPKVREPFLQRWHETTELIAAFDGAPLPTNPESQLCSPRYCSYWEVCPMGTALNG